MDRTRGGGIFSGLLGKILFIIVLFILVGNFKPQLEYGATTSWEWSTTAFYKLRNWWDSLDSSPVRKTRMDRQEKVDRTPPSYAL